MFTSKEEVIEFLKVNKITDEEISQIKIGNKFGTLYQESPTRSSVSIIMSGDENILKKINEFLPIYNDGIYL